MNSVITTGLFTVGGSAVTGALTYFVTSRNIRASDRQSAAARTHEAEQREADRQNALRAVRLAAHDAATRRSYIVVQTLVRFTDEWLGWMRLSVLTGTEGEAPIPPADSESAYAEIDLTITGKTRETYLEFRRAQNGLQEAYRQVIQVRESGTLDQGPTTLTNTTQAFHGAATHFLESSNAITEELRRDFDPAHSV